jgi:cell division inhibitor SepF
MSGFYKKAVVWLGLNEEYPDDSASIDAGVAGGSMTEHQDPSSSRPVGPEPRTDRMPQGRREDARVPDPLAHNRNAPDRSEGTVRAVPMDEPAVHRAIGTVRAVAVPRTTKPKTIVPKSFNDAQEVADHFRELTPVIVNMQSAERDLARRLIDFSSGLCYGLGGQMEKVAKDVYLLTPDDVEVADEERQNYSP